MKPIFLILLTIWSTVVGLAQETNTPVVQQPSSAAGTNGVPSSGAPPPSAPAQRAPAELEKLAMPIALHPDPLIAIILPACVYPVEVVQAARFVKDTNNIAKVDEQSWDENVKAVAKFPDVIAMMDSNLTWTVQLGQAFVDQPKELMDAIQALRLKAKQAGTLQSSDQQVVTVTNEVVVQTNVTQVVTVTNQIVQVQPSNPEVIYVPTYSSTVYYPPPGYVYDPVAPLVTFGVGMAMGAIIANNCDWHGGGVYVGPHGAAFWGGGYHGDVDVDIDRNINVNENINRNTDVNRNVNRTTTQQQKWQPNQSRMQTSGAGATAQNAAARGWGDASQRAQAAQQTAAAGGSRPSQPSAAAGGATRPSQTPGAAGGTRPSQPPAAGAGAGGQPSAGARPGGGATRPSTPQQPPAASRPTPSPSPSPSRPSAPQTASRPAPQSSPAFSGVSSGAGAQSAASRGAASRGGGGGRGGGGRR
jgi:uncharacterized protein DUF3300